MRERDEGGFAVVGAHATLADTAKGQVSIGHMHDGIVDTAATELNVGQHITFHLSAAGEQIQSEWVLWQRLHLLVELTKLAVLNQWQYWAKDFFLHDRVSHGDAAEDGGGNKLLLTIRVTTDEHFGFIDQGNNAVKLAVIDHAANVRIVDAAIAIKRFYGVDDFFFKLGPNFAVDKDMVRRNTGLPDVHHFAGYDTFSCQFQVGILVHDSRALAT